MINLHSPLKGEIVPLSEVNDPVFAQGMMGNGIAIQPTEGKVVAPFDGCVLMIFQTNHAIGLVDENGVEVLIHIGMDTVELKGQGFTPRIEEGQSFKTGDTLIEFDIEFIKQAGYPTVTPIVITNSDLYKKTNETTQSTVEFKDALMSVSW